MKGMSTSNIVGFLSQGVRILDSRAIDHIASFFIISNLYIKIINRDQLNTLGNGDSVLMWIWEYNFRITTGQ